MMLGGWRRNQAKGRQARFDARQERDSNDLGKTYFNLDKLHQASRCVHVAYLAKN